MKYHKLCYLPRQVFSILASREICVLIFDFLDDWLKFLAFLHELKVTFTPPLIVLAFFGVSMVCKLCIFQTQ